ncbi:MAG: WG repeat-containing protein [Patescibacteria group bacterium]
MHNCETDNPELHIAMKAKLYEVIAKANRLGMSLITPIVLQSNINLVRNYCFKSKLNGLVFDEDFFSFLWRQSSLIHKIYSICLGLGYAQINKESPKLSFEKDNMEKEVLRFLVDMTSGVYDNDTIAYNLENQIVFVHIPTGIKLVLNPDNRDYNGRSIYPKQLTLIHNLHELEDDFYNGSVPSLGGVSLFQFWSFYSCGLDEVISNHRVDKIQADPSPTIINKKEFLPKKFKQPFYLPNNGKYGFKDQEGNIVIEPIYHSACNFCFQMAKVTDGRFVGYINPAGEVVIPLMYNAGYSFKEELACVRHSGKWGYINLAGKIVIPTIYDIAYSFKNGVAKVKQSGKWYLIDKSGKRVQEL